MAQVSVDYFSFCSNNSRMDKLGAMKTFVQIIESGSLTRAADSLDTSLPTVVRTLAALERDDQRDRLHVEPIRQRLILVFASRQSAQSSFYRRRADFFDSATISGEARTARLTIPCHPDAYAFWGYACRES